jgi:hypothetical protein
MYHYLKQHPEICLPSVKELAFFSNGKEALGIEGYLKSFCRASRKQIVGEVSSTYLSWPGAARGIADVLGANTKIIVLLRNPVDFAYSLWGQNCRDKLETRTFEEAYFSSRSGRRPNFHRQNINLAYRYRARYCLQLEEYVDIFQDNLWVYIFEHIFSDIDGCLKQLFHRLGASSDVSVDTSRRHNPSSTVRFSLLHALYSRPGATSRLARGLVPFKLRRMLMQKLYEMNTRVVERQTLNAEIRQKILQDVADDLCHLESMLGIRVREIWRR